MNEEILQKIGYHGVRETVNTLSSFDCCTDITVNQSSIVDYPPEDHEINTYTEVGGEHDFVLLFHTVASLAEKISARMMGSSTDLDEDTILDAMRELANVVVGALKTKCHPMDMEFSTPIAYGELYPLDVAYPERTQMLVAQMTLDGEPFELCICVVE